MKTHTQYSQNEENLLFLLLFVVVYYMFTLGSCVVNKAF